MINLDKIRYVIFFCFLPQSGPKYRFVTFLCLSLLQSLFKYFCTCSSSKEVFLSNKRAKLSSGMVGIPLEYSIK